MPSFATLNSTRKLVKILMVALLPKILASIALGACAATAAAVSSTPTVNLGYATYQGVLVEDPLSNQTNINFLGVRYAANPTGIPYMLLSHLFTTDLCAPIRDQAFPRGGNTRLHSRSSAGQRTTGVMSSSEQWQCSHQSIRGLFVINYRIPGHRRLTSRRRLPVLEVGSRTPRCGLS